MQKLLAVIDRVLSDLKPVGVLVPQSIAYLEQLATPTTEQGREYLINRIHNCINQLWDCAEIAGDRDLQSATILYRAGIALYIAIDDFDR